jgi:hypothetical protein
MRRAKELEGLCKQPTESLKDNQQIGVSRINRKACKNFRILSSTSWYVHLG